MQVDVSARTLSFPRMCACCGAPPQAEYHATAVRVTGKRVVRTQSATWPIPYCYACLRHASVWPKEWSGLTWFLVLITCFVWIVIQLLLDATARTKAEGMRTTSCCCAAPAAAYLGWNGSTHSFNFSSISFAFEFILANRNRVLNVPYHVQAELERYVANKVRVEASVNASSPASSKSKANQTITNPADEERIITEALERIEKAKGPAARRNALDAALNRIQSPERRTRLLKEAARLEVHAVLDKVDSLKSPAAKRRHIEAALAQIRSDPVPDELQVQEIEWLENALRELDGPKNV